MLRQHLCDQTEILEFPSDHDSRGHFSQWYADGLADKRNRARGPWVDLEHVNIFPLHGELNVHEATDIECDRQIDGMFSDLGLDFQADGLRRQATGAVAGMNARPLDMLHDAANDYGITVAQRVDIHFDGVVEEFIDEHRMLGRCRQDRKSTRLNSSHRCISYAVFCLKNKRRAHEAA